MQHDSTRFPALLSNAEAQCQNYSIFELLLDMLVYYTEQVTEIQSIVDCKVECKVCIGLCSLSNTEMLSL